MSLTCPGCSAENSETQRFCGQCGSPLSRACIDCGTELTSDQKFCGQCGTKVGESSDGEVGDPVSRSESSEGEAAAAVAERRLVSVVFVDLVGFTTLSEGRDPEEIRELLSDYFEEANRVVVRYGGSIEKFIGDAVMAVWGTPAAQEDDAERAVRAALDMVEAVETLGESRALTGLSARAGVVTGHVAVTIGAEGQGMVAGDIVNTAARVQSVASPGEVYVDETTRGSASSSIGFVDAGTHPLKGKADPVALFEVKSIVAGVRGAQRVDGLEAPFTGRSRELRLVKELFHDAAEQSRARLLSVTGVTGVGKSRLGWELAKYIDGLASLNYWHIGRAPSYGDGVAYRALAEVVRMRLRIAEADPDDVTLTKLEEGLDAYISDPGERGWLKPRMAVLLGIADLVEESPGDGSRDELFAGWRLFFERLAEANPVVMLFEDMHLADDGVLDFIEYLLEWSSQLPIFVITLSRPEIEERRPNWARSRNAITLHLDPLGPEAVAEMLDGLVGGLPESMRSELAQRVEGIPVFAIEIVRMLIDRDVVVPRDGKYVLADGIESLESLDVPATLHALVASRLDSLPEAERWLVSDAAVVGHTFDPDALAAVVAATGRPVDAIREQLDDLVRREIFTGHLDPLSPERGQYRFVQKVMRGVAYDTLSRRDRRARHLAIAHHLEQTLDADDIAGVLAAHYVDAAEAVPDADDVVELFDTARRHLVAAARRASKLAAPDEALRYIERALPLTDDVGEQATLHEEAGAAALASSRSDDALTHLDASEKLYREVSDQSGIARVVAKQGDSLLDLGRLDESIDRASRCFDELGESVGDAERAMLASVVAAGYSTLTKSEEAAPWIEIAIDAGEKAAAWEQLARALNVKGLHSFAIGRRVEGMALIKAALELSREHELGIRAVVQYGNLALFHIDTDLDAAVDLADKALDAARLVGDRRMGAFALGAKRAALLHLGQWDGVLETDERWSQEDVPIFFKVSLNYPVACVVAWRGGDAESVIGDGPSDDADPATKSVTWTCQALAAHERGDAETAFIVARQAVDLLQEYWNEVEDFLVAWPTLIDSALALGRLDDADAALGSVADRPEGRIPLALRAQIKRFSARLGAARGEHDSVDEMFGKAERLFVEYQGPFWLALTQLEHGEWAAAQGREEQAARLASAALAVFEDLGATPSIDRARALLDSVAPEQVEV